MSDAPAHASSDPRRALRRSLLARRDTFAASAGHAAAALALHEALIVLIAELEPTCLGLYWPVRSESNAAAAFAADAQHGEMSLALPFARRDPATMEFRRWDGTSPTRVDDCGIGAAGGPAVAPDVVVVPCVGFTAVGHRLGYGGGYYDRWLAAHPAVTAIGVAFSFAEIEVAAFDAQPHDVALALIVTELGVR